MKAARKYLDALNSLSREWPHRLRGTLETVQASPEPCLSWLFLNSLVSYLVHIFSGFALEPWNMSNSPGRKDGGLLINLTLLTPMLGAEISQESIEGGMRNAVPQGRNWDRHAECYADATDP